MLKPTFTMLLLFIGVSLWAQKAELDKVQQSLKDKKEQYGDIAHQIWEWAELGYQEEKSSTLLQKTLKEAGFALEAGVAEIPTAFTATYGTGKPVIAILGAFDALPGANNILAL